MNTLIWCSFLYWRGTRLTLVWGETMKKRSVSHWKRPVWCFSRGFSELKCTILFTAMLFLYITAAKEVFTNEKKCHFCFVFAWEYSRRGSVISTTFLKRFYFFKTLVNVTKIPKSFWVSSFVTSGGYFSSFRNQMMMRTMKLWWIETLWEHLENTSHVS